jgi:hypothetical protein
VRSSCRDRTFDLSLLIRERLNTLNIPNNLAISDSNTGNIDRISDPILRTVSTENIERIRSLIFSTDQINPSINGIRENFLNILERYRSDLEIYR